MSELTERIRSRGFWRFLLRPTTFDAERIGYDELEDLIRTSEVSFRGWNVPHFRLPLDRGVDWVGQESQFHHHLESWRLYTSGQFLDLVSFASDWKDESGLDVPERGWEPGKVTPVWESLFRFTEFFEFAARLALRIRGDDQAAVSILTGGLRGRGLVVGDRRRSEFFEPYVASIDSYTFDRIYEWDDLVGLAHTEAVRASRELFLRFGWNGATESLLADYQSELIDGR